MSEVQKLTALYIEEHKLSIHNYESWGKAVAEKILVEAMTRVDGSRSELKLEVGDFSPSLLP